MRSLALTFIFLATNTFAATQEVQMFEDPNTPSASIAVVNASPASPAKVTPLTHGNKFKLFVSSSVAAGNFFGAAIEAGLSQRDHENLGFGQGAIGFRGRFGAAPADRASFNLLALYALPSALEHSPGTSRNAPARLSPEHGLQPLVRLSQSETPAVLPSILRSCLGLLQQEASRLSTIPNQNEA
jgi:hypothetical protein